MSEVPPWSHLAEQRQLACPRSEWPKHAPRVVVLRAKAFDRNRPPHYVLGPWVQDDHQWWAWARKLLPRSRFRGVLYAARIHINGFGTDNEYRFLAFDHTFDWVQQEEWGCSNSVRKIPAGDPLLTTDTGHRLFSSRGIYPAKPGDVPVLMDFCDRQIERIYGGLSCRKP